MYNLFLDDIRDPKDVTWVKLPDVEWVIVRNYDQFVETITRQGIPKFIAFDHDLADEHYAATDYRTVLPTWDGSRRRGNPVDVELSERTGYDCAKWLVDYCRNNSCTICDFVVHSMNPVGAENIRKYLINAKSS